MWILASGVGAFEHDLDAPVLHAALRSIEHEQRYRAMREVLMLADIVDAAEARYPPLLDHEREAAALGYPALASERRW